jgi:hypothetical protein
MIEGADRPPEVFCDEVVEDETEHDLLSDDEIDLGRD